MNTDVLVIGAGLAGLVATAEAADAGRSVVVLDQEPAASLGGQAFWSLGGLFLIDSPEQRRMGIRDSAELAADDWFGSAGFDRPEDFWPRQWAQAYLDFAAGEKRSWLRQQGLRLFPVVQWAERGGYQVGGHGNSVPRFHLTWGTGPGVVTPVLRRVMHHVRAGRVTLSFRHRVTELLTSGRAVTGARGELLAASTAARGEPSNRSVIGDWEISAGAVVVASGGIGANHELVRRNWPAGFGEVPGRMLSGVPDSTDGLMLGVAAAAGGRLINGDRMWPLPGRRGQPQPGVATARHPHPARADLAVAGRDRPSAAHATVPRFRRARGRLRAITAGGHGYSWFLLNHRTVGPEFGLSGSEQNPDLTGRSIRKLLTQRAGGKIGPGTAAFLEDGEDFLTADTLPELVAKMNALAGTDLIDADALAVTVAQRDRQVRARLGKDPQVVMTAAARRFAGDRPDAGWSRRTSCSTRRPAR